MKPITAYQSLDELYADPSPLDIEDGLRLQGELSQVGGWRELFDFSSHQWVTSTLSEKVAIVERLQQFLQCGFDKLVWLWAKDCLGSDHSRYRLDGFPHAVLELSAEWRPAEDYLMRCKHPIFRRFNRAQVAHWKAVILADIQTPPHLEVTKASVNLLLLF